MFLDLANLSAITIALPTIQKEWAVSEGDLQWVISAYSITVHYSKWKLEITAMLIKSLSSERSCY